MRDLVDIIIGQEETTYQPEINGIEGIDTDDHEMDLMEHLEWEQEMYG